ncbi:CDGSH iron-sulfur domain-containing protein [Streptomyces exfoliatus]|uniref:CDGSH iron-sulfur domain-containing protein n=1 Tax=Streptomyces exfoliatus TaxID=1905 RepID=UPI003C2E5CB2
MPSTSDRSERPRPDGAAVRRVTLNAAGPVLVEGPVEVVLPDGALARSDRFVVAICTCRRSRTYPWCDTSHRRHERADSRPGDRNPS